MEGNSKEGDSDMSWEHDSPVVIFKDPRPFAEYANEHSKRSFDAFTEGEHLPQSRSFSDYAMAQTLGPDIQGIDPSWPTNPVLQEARAPTGDNSKAWRYLVQAPCNWFSSLAVNSIAHLASTKAWKDFYGRTRYLLSGNKHIETSLTAVEQIADGAKRRSVELATSHHEKRMSNQEQARRQSYYQRRASERNREHIYSAHEQTVQFSNPDNDFAPGEYYMSGALTDDDIDTPRTPTHPHVMPGTWVESPATDAAQYWNSCPDDIYADSANPGSDANAIATSPSAPTKALATRPAWPYCGNEIHHVELTSMDVDDEESVMSATDIAEEGTSSDSIIAPEDLDTTSSSDSDDFHMLDTDSLELESLASRPQHPATHGYGSQAVPSGPYAHHNNTDPDAIQRAAADEMQAILDDSSMLSEDPLDLQSPALPLDVPNSPLISDPGHEIKLIQTPQTATVTSTVSGMSPLSPSNHSRSTPSTTSSKAARSKVSPKDSPEWSYTLSPKHRYSSPFHRTPIYHPVPPPVRLFPYGLALSRAGSPKKRLTFFESPKKRVTFFESPKTGMPVNRYKKYIIGESMDVSYVSASERDCSMLSDTSATGSLYTSPTGQENSEKQSMIEQRDQELYRSFSADFAPIGARAHIPVIPPQRVFSDITNARTRQQRGAAGFAVTTSVENSMHSQSLSTESEEDINPSFDNATLAFAKESHLGKENKSTFSQIDVLADSPLTVSSSNNGSTSLSNFTHAVTPTRGQGSLAHGTESCSPTERPLSNQTTHIPATSNPTANGTLAHGKDASSNEDHSPSNQIEPAAALTPPSLSSFQGPSMDDNDSTSQALFTSNSSNSFEPSTATGTPEDRSDDEVLGIEKGTGSPASWSSSAKSILEVGIDSTSTTNGISPLDQLGVSGVTVTAESSFAEGTLVIGKDSISTKNGISLSDQVDASAIDSTPAPKLTEGTLVIGKDSPSAKKGSSPSDQVDAPATPSPSQIARQIAGLNVSGRRTSSRLTTKALKDAERLAAKEARIAAEKARKEKEEAEEKARKKKELEAERKRTGVRRTPVAKAIEPLSDEWEARVTETMKEKHLMKVLTTSVAATEITRRDLGKVLPQRGVPGEDQSGWLNDTIVTAYLDTAVDHALKMSGYKRGDVPKQVAFSTYFYPRLAGDGAASVTRWVKRAKIEGKKMKEVERIYIPINQNDNHWTLLVISPKFKTIEYFDSFHGNPTKVLENAKKLLENELGGDYRESEWTVKGRGGPRQTNGSDCGVFVSTTVKMISLGVDPMAYSASDIPLQRRRIVAELMNRGFDGELAPNVVFADDD